MGSQGKPIASIGFSRAVIYNRHQAGPAQTRVNIMCGGM